MPSLKIVKSSVLLLASLNSPLIFSPMLHDPRTNQARGGNFQPKFPSPRTFHLTALASSQLEFAHFSLTNHLKAVNSRPRKITCASTKRRSEHGFLESTSQACESYSCARTYWYVYLWCFGLISPHLPLFISSGVLHRNSETPTFSCSWREKILSALHCEAHNWQLKPDRIPWRRHSSPCGVYGWPDKKYYSKRQGTRYVRLSIVIFFLALLSAPQFHSSSLLYEHSGFQETNSIFKS